MVETVAPAPASPPYAAAPQHTTSEGLLDLTSTTTTAALQDTFHHDTTHTTNDSTISATAVLSSTTKLSSDIYARPSFTSSTSSSLSLDTLSSKTNSSNNMSEQLLNLSASNSSSSKSRVLETTATSIITSESGVVGSQVVVAALDIGEGLTTIDTSSLTSVELSPHVSYDAGNNNNSSINTTNNNNNSSTAPSKVCRTVTAHGTIVPPLASNVQESASASRHSLEDATPPSSPAVRVRSRPSSQHSSPSFPLLPSPADLSTKLYTHSHHEQQDASFSPSSPPVSLVRHPPIKSPLANYTLKSPFPREQQQLRPTQYNNNSNNGDSPSSSSSSSSLCAGGPEVVKFSLSSSQDIKPGTSESKSPLAGSGGDARYTTPSSSTTTSMTPPNRSSGGSSCPQSPASSPPVVVSSSPPTSPPLLPLVSGAGSEVKGMPANPVSLAYGADTSSSMAVDSCDSGRLTFFRGG